jgi:hypothetical protein
MADPTVTTWLPFRNVNGLLREDLRLPAGLHVVSDAGEWARDWAGPPSEPPVPAVDWETEMCVVAALGTCPSTGYSVLIDAISVLGDRMSVVVWDIRPGPNCFSLCAITHPLHAVAVPVRVGTTEMFRRVAYQDCEATD